MSFIMSQINTNTGNVLHTLNSTLPLLCPLSIVSGMHKSIIHGAGEEICFPFIVSKKYLKGCILVFEYYYFLSQNNSNARNALKIAVKKYQQSDTQAIASNALLDAIQKYNDNKHTLTNVIVDIILNNLMCKFPMFHEHLSN